MRSAALADTKLIGRIEKFPLVFSNESVGLLELVSIAIQGLLATLVVVGPCCPGYVPFYSPLAIRAIHIILADKLGNEGGEALLARAAAKATS